MHHETHENPIPCFSGLEPPPLTLVLRNSDLFPPSECQGLLQM